MLHEGSRVCKIVSKFIVKKKYYKKMSVLKHLKQHKEKFL